MPEFEFYDINHRVIILNSGSMPRKRTGRKRCKFSLPECATLQRDVTRANGPSWGLGGGERAEEKYAFCISRELQRFLSLFCLLEESMGGPLPY